VTSRKTEKPGPDLKGKHWGNESCGADYIGNKVKTEGGRKPEKTEEKEDKRGGHLKERGGRLLKKRKNRLSAAGPASQSMGRQGKESVSAAQNGGRKRR